MMELPPQIVSANIQKDILFNNKFLLIYIDLWSFTALPLISEMYDS